MTPDVTVRAAVAADAAAVARIDVEAGNAGFGDVLGARVLDDDRIARWARDLTTGPQRWWIAERAGRTIGFAGVGPSRDPVEPRLGELDTIAVDPICWRTGAGRALMTVALRHLADHFTGAILWTVAGVDRSLRFYAATGWAPTGATRDGGRQIAFRHPLGGAG
jgi:GNAT superfamily N-acetyltransferase